MLKSREEAKSLREMLSFSKKEQKDPLLDYLLNFKDRRAHAKELLTDEALTAFFFVTLPESLPIAVITRFINWFYEFGIPVGGVIVNGLIPKEQLSADSAEFVKNRVMMQDEHMQEIWEIFNDRIRAIVPLFETEVKGSAMLNRMVEVLDGQVNLGVLQMKNKGTASLVLIMENHFPYFWHDLELKNRESP